MAEKLIILLSVALVLAACFLLLFGRLARREHRLKGTKKHDGRKGGGSTGFPGPSPT